MHSSIQQIAGVAHDTHGARYNSWSFC